MNDKLFVERILEFCDVPQLFVARDVFDLFIFVYFMGIIQRVYTRQYEF